MDGAGRPARVAEGNSLRSRRQRNGRPEACVTISIAKRSKATRNGASTIADDLRELSSAKGTGAARRRQGSPKGADLIPNEPMEMEPGSAGQRRRQQKGDLRRLAPHPESTSPQAETKEGQEPECSPPQGRSESAPPHEGFTARQAFSGNRNWPPPQEVSPRHVRGGNYELWRAFFILFAIYLTAFAACISTAVIFCWMLQPAPGASADNLVLNRQQPTAAGKPEERMDDQGDERIESWQAGGRRSAANPEEKGFGQVGKEGRIRHTRSALNEANFTPNLPAATELVFSGHDCSVPYNLTAVTIEHSFSCNEGDLKREQVKKEFVLLQEAVRTRITVRECVASYSRLNHVCAGAGHSSLNAYECAINEPYDLSVEECRRAHRMGMFVRPHQSPHWYEEKGGKSMPARLHKNETTYFQWQRAGKLYTNDDQDVHCYGSWWTFEKEFKCNGHDCKNHHSVVTDFMEFSVFEREAFMYRDNEGIERIMVDHNQLVLPCPTTGGHCTIQKGGGVYLWDRPSDRDSCPFYKLRDTVGVDVTTPGEEGITYLSTDDTMIRIRKQGRPIMRCGDLVYPTEYPRLFLTEATSNPDFSRKLPLSEGSTFLYFNQKLQYIWGGIQDDLETAVLNMRTDNCKQDISNRFREYASRAAEQRSVVDGDTVYIGGHRYGTAEGEVWWVYSCRPLFMVARPTPGTCYDALPVRLSNDDLKRRMANERRRMATEEIIITDAEVELAQNGTTGQYGYFMEPKTHRLLTAAATTICTGQMPPMYQNAQGRWLAYTMGHLSKTSAPQTITDAVRNVTHERGEYFPEGGIYPGPTVLELEQHHQARRAEMGIIAALKDNWRRQQGNQADPSRGWEDVTWNPRMPDPTAMAGIKALEWFWKMVEGYGTICGLLIGTLILFKFTCFCFGVIMRLCTVPQTPNLCVHVLGAFLPSITERLTRGLYKPKGAPGPCHEMASACCGGRDLGTPEDSDDDAPKDRENIRRFHERKRQRRTSSGNRLLKVGRQRQHREDRDRQDEDERRNILTAHRSRPPPGYEGEPVGYAGAYPETGFETMPPMQHVPMTSRRPPPEELSTPPPIH